METKSEKLARSKKLLKKFQTKPKPSKENATEEIEIVDDSTATAEIPENNSVQSDISTVNFFNATPENNNDVSMDIGNYFKNDAPSVNWPAVENKIPEAVIEDTTENVSQVESLNQLNAQMKSLIHSEELMNSCVNNTSDLEVRNQQLDKFLQNEKNRSQELNLKLLEHNSLIEELKIQISKLQIENSTKVTMEIGPIQEQLQSHIQTIGILVGEKAELTASLTKYQNMAEEKSGEVEELQGRLGASRHRVQDLEKEMNRLKSSRETTDESHQKISSEMDRNNQEILRLNKINEEISDEISELKQKLFLKNKSFNELQEELQRKNSELNISHLRVEQLSSGDVTSVDSQIENLAQQRIAYEQQINELQKMVQQLGSERDQANGQYQNYVQQLNKEVNFFKEKNEELSEENDRLLKREESLVKHMTDLEKQLQQHMSRQKSETSEVKDKGVGEKEDLKVLNDKLMKFESERDDLLRKVEEFNSNGNKLQFLINEKDEFIRNLENKLEQIESVQPDSSRLNASIESDKIAASRAVLQNQELKFQLDEIQKAFVQVSNDKLEITDKLQSEQHLCREMKTKYTEMEENLTAVKQKFDLKDEEMMRLSHENTELTKQNLLNTQELDRLRHYQAGNQMGGVLQNQLQNANEQIMKLKNRLKDLDGEKSHILNKMISKENKTDGTEVEEVDNVEVTVAEEIQEISVNDLLLEEMTRKTNESIVIPTYEAMEKLQDRFSRTMNEIADLTDEKQKLEHLVIQLQGETETIGEYVALYQTQRRLLKQREVEKDIQMHKLAVDREMMKDKLVQLNNLVEQLLTQKGIDSNHLIDNLSNNNLNVNDSTDGSVISQTQEIHAGKANHLLEKTHSPIESKNTAEKIINLLSEIKDSNYSNLSHAGGVHHCHCCSGKLETV